MSLKRCQIFISQDSYGRPARKIPGFGDRLTVTNGIDDDDLDDLRTTVPVFVVNAVVEEQFNTTPLPIRLDSAEALTAQAEKIVQVHLKLNVTKT